MSLRVSENSNYLMYFIDEGRHFAIFIHICLSFKKALSHAIYPFTGKGDLILAAIHLAAFLMSISFGNNHHVINVRIKEVWLFLFFSCPWSNKTISISAKFTDCPR